MELTKRSGDFQRSVISYSIFTGDQETLAQNQTLFYTGSPIFALYATLDVTEFREKFEVQVPDLEQIIRQAKEKASPEAQNVQIYPIYITPIRFETEEALLTSPEDIVNTGNYPNPELCEKAIKLGLDFFLLQLDKQLYGDSSELSLTQTEDTTPALTHEDFREKSLMQHLIHEYVSPMLYAIKSEDESSANALRQRFLNFARGSHFAADVIELTDLLLNGSVGPIVDAYLKKIDAIHTENYELAGIERDKIKRLKTSP